MAKAIDQMTTEELLAEKKKQADAAKAATERQAEIDLRLATQSIIDVVKTLRVPELFAKIREKSGDADLADTAILAAIAEAAGLTGIEIKKAAKKKSSGGATGTRKTYTDEFKAKAVKMVTGSKKTSAVAKELGVASGSLAKWVEAAKKK